MKQDLLFATKTCSKMKTKNDKFNFERRGLYEEVCSV